MKVTLATDAPEAAKADLLAVAVRSDRLTRDPVVRALHKASGGALNPQIVLEGFKAKPGETLRVALSGIGAKQVLLFGLGEKDATPVSARTLAAYAGRAASSFSSVAIVAPNTDAATLRALSSGVILGAYRYTDYLTGDRKPSEQLKTAKVVVEKRESSFRRSITDGIALGESVCAARDLVNAPPNDLTPTALADFAKAQCKEHGVTCKVWDKKGVERLGMNLLLAVNRGSAEEPRFIHMTYKPKNASKKTKKVVFVGKGLTFDAGGLCLKPPKGMLDMKCDMGGSAITIGIVLAAARLGLKVEVHGIIGSTENMTGAAAFRPGDVFKSLDGKMVEIINTDAEGRLVLADALAYARKLEPDVMFDHATLTGACIVALGPYTAGLFTDSEGVASAYAAAASEEGESYWRLPLNPDLRDMLRSDIADLKHTGDRAGGSITAALFLREFVGDTTWCHLDVAGPTFLSGTKGINPKGGTGFGVMTAIKYLENL